MDVELWKRQPFCVNFLLLFVNKHLEVYYADIQNY